MQSELMILGQCLAALVLGGLLGWERETAGKWAGLRTHMLVCIGVVLFVRLGQSLLQDAVLQYGTDALGGDPTRLIEAVATAIAFLGAGAIIRDREQSMTRGLTTAASLFLAAAVGIAIGLDQYIVAIGATFLALFVLRILGWIEQDLPLKAKHSRKK